MRCLSVAEFCLGSSDAESTKPGDILEISTDLAIELIEDGLVVDFAGYEEKAAILQYDACYSCDLAEALAWCFTVCMLTPDMAKLCERVRPCPKYDGKGCSSMRTRFTLRSSARLLT